MEYKIDIARRRDKNGERGFIINPVSKGGWVLSDGIKVKGKLLRFKTEKEAEDYARNLQTPATT